MKDASQHLLPLSKKGFFIMVSTVAIMSTAAGANLVKAQTIENQKIVFSEGLEWMKSQASLNGDNLTIDFSNHFSSSIKEGSIQLESSSNNNVVSISVNELTLNLAVKGFGDSIIKVTATDKDGNTVTDQFNLRISKKGDINGDGVITPADVLQIYQVTSGKVKLNEEEMKLLDINGDGKVTNADASELMSRYVGKQPSTLADHDYLVVLTELNDAPTAKEDHYTVQEDTNLKVVAGASLLQNDVDPEGNNLTVTKVSGPAHGTLTLNPDGTFTYVPDANFNGTDQFTYKVSDGQADSEEQTVTIEVQAVNDAPVANDGSLEVTEDEVAQGTLSGSDIEGDTLTYSLVENGKKGTVAINSTTGTYTYTPNENENGADSFSFKVNDGMADSVVVTIPVTIQAVNDAPKANEDQFTLSEDQTLNVVDSASILLNDVDVEGDVLTVTKVSGPAHGTLTLNPDGTFSYVPDANFNGTDQFTYKVSDGQADSEEQTVTIEVQAVNDAPVANDSSLEVTEDEVAQGTLSGSDIEGDTLTYSLVENGKKGTVAINSTTGTYTYTPNENENGADSFSFKVNDGMADSVVVTVPVTIQAVNDAPKANEDQFTLSEDQTLNVVESASILLNDVDVEGDVLTVTKVSGPAHGTLTLNPDGTFTYVPDANFNGTDQFTYKVSDGQADSEEQTVTIEVQAVNDAPVANDGSLEVTEDEVAQGALSGSDIEGDTLTYSLVEDGKKGTVAINPTTGAYTYTPNANENGADSFSFKVNDGMADSVVVTIPVTIQAVNDAPVISGVSIDGKMELGETVQGVYSYTDVENDSEGNSTFKWYRSKQQDGNDKEVISGATTKEYTIQDSDEDYYLFFEVTPVASSGAQTTQVLTSLASKKIVGSTPLMTVSPDPYRPDPLAPLSEYELTSQGGAYVTLNLSGDTFKDDITADDFVLNNAPAGTTLTLAMRIDGSTAGLLMEFDGTDFDLDIPNFSVTAKPSATVKGKGVTSNEMTILASEDEPTPFISEYLQGDIDRSGIEVYFPSGTNTVSGLELEVHQWNVSTGSKSVVKIPLNMGIAQNMTYNIINPTFYDAFDIMNMWYYNEDGYFITKQGYINNAIVLKKDGKVIDTIGDPVFKGPTPIFANGGTMVRNSTITDGLSTYNQKQWAIYPAGTYQFFGSHVVNK